MGALTHNGDVITGLPSTASQINYDNTDSQLQATQVQDAIDELKDLDKNIFEGTATQWNALSTAQKKTYDYAVIKDDFSLAASEVSFDTTSVTNPYLKNVSNVNQAIAQQANMIPLSLGQFVLQINGSVDVSLPTTGYSSYAIWNSYSGKHGLSIVTVSSSGIVSRTDIYGNTALSFSKPNSSTLRISSTDRVTVSVQYIGNS